MVRHIRVATLNPELTCLICKGYFVKATTVTECMHTFCKGCIVKHLQTKNTCPRCDVVIHRSNPLQHIKLDSTLQDLTFKLVPNLYHREVQRERFFWQIQGLPYPEESRKSSSDPPEDMEKIRKKSQSEFKSDEKVCIELDAKENGFDPLPRKYICCSSRTTVTHLKKLVAKKVFGDLDKYYTIDILCKEEVLGKDHTLKFIYLTRWRFDELPIRLSYKPKTDILK